MSSYIVAIALAVLTAAVYACQNLSAITVRFLNFEMSFQQGVWEAIVFSAGVLLMWIFSIFALIESSFKNRSKIKERDAKIASLEEERKSLLSAINNIAPNASVQYDNLPAPDGAVKDSAD
jgi:uncharacterized membrane protein YciS (DUF1049 family)